MPKPRTYLLLRDGLGIDVRRWNPEQIAQLVYISLKVACSFRLEPAMTLEGFLSGEDDNPGKAWAEATLPFLEAAVDHMNREEHE